MKLGNQKNSKMAKEICDGFDTIDDMCCDRRLVVRIILSHKKPFLKRKKCFKKLSIELLERRTVKDPSLMNGGEDMTNQP